MIISSNLLVSTNPWIFQASVHHICDYWFLLIYVDYPLNISGVWSSICSCSTSLLIILVNTWECFWFLLILIYPALFLCGIYICLWIPDSLHSLPNIAIWLHVWVNAYCYLLLIPSIFMCEYTCYVLKFPCMYIRICEWIYITDWFLSHTCAYMFMFAYCLIFMYLYMWMNLLFFFS